MFLSWLFLRSSLGCFFNVYIILKVNDRKQETISLKNYNFYSQSTRNILTGMYTLCLTFSFYFYLYIHIFFYIHINLSIYLIFYVFIYLPIFLFFLSVHLSQYLSRCVLFLSSLSLHLCFTYIYLYKFDIWEKF